MKQLTDNVYVENQWTSVSRPTAGSNSGFVKTSEGIVMIDAPEVPDNAIRWRDIIAEKGEVIYIINTEYHIDHTLGNYFFSGTVISHEETMRSLVDHLGTTEEIRRKVKEKYPESSYLMMNYQIKSPKITFYDKLNLYLGKHKFELLHLPGHTLGQIGVYIPQERIIFTGDNFTNGVQASLAYCHPLEWMDSLKKILDLNVDIIVPGHGEIGDKKALQKFAAFLSQCIDMVNEAIEKGMSRQEAVDIIQFENLLTPYHSGRDYQRNNVNRLYDMLAKSKDK